ncbi:hypothetical protein MMC25_004359 [Agyrium rufum]|nr:hypothetical protein [Agyrium rufum]
MPTTKVSEKAACKSDEPTIATSTPTCNSYESVVELEAVKEQNRQMRSRLITATQFLRKIRIQLKPKLQSLETEVAGLRGQLRNMEILLRVYQERDLLEAGRAGDDFVDEGIDLDI